jgi:hypothetical protein
MPIRSSRSYLLPIIALFGTGCYGTFDAGYVDPKKPAHEGAFFDEISDAGGDVGKLNAGELNLSRRMVRYCLRRSVHDEDRAGLEATGDSLILISGLTSGGTGAVLATVAGAMNEGGRRKDVAQGGIALVSAAAGILALRAALEWNDRSRVRREAAARRQTAAAKIQAAETIAEKIAAFAACVDEDVKVAAAISGSNDGNTLAEQAKYDQKALSSAVASAVKKAEAEKQLSEAKKGQEDANNALLAGATGVDRLSETVKLEENKILEKFSEVTLAESAIKDAEAELAKAGKNEATVREELGNFRPPVNSSIPLGVLAKVTEAELKVARAKQKVAEEKMARGAAIEKVGKAKEEASQSILGVFGGLTTTEKKTAEAVKAEARGKALASEGTEDKKKGVALKAAAEGEKEKHKKNVGALEEKKTQLTTKPKPKPE